MKLLVPAGVDVSCLVPGHPRYPRQDQLLEGACHRDHRPLWLRKVRRHARGPPWPSGHLCAHGRRTQSWESNLYKRLSLDGPDMLSQLFNRVAAELQKDPEAPSKVPILVLDIPRETTEGAPLSFWSLLQVFPRPRYAAGVEFCEGDVLGPAGRCCARGGPGAVSHARSAHRGLKYEPRSSFVPPPQAQR